VSSALLDELIDGLRCLPGVGPKSAQRMALHLLQRDRAGATRLGGLLTHLSPLDGIGPKDLGLDLLESQLAAGGITEITLAINPTLEGQATARYITDLATRYATPVLQIARGVPLGSELEFADSSTLSVAFAERAPLRSD